MMKSFFLIIAMGILPVWGLAQGEAYNWYFKDLGPNTGLSFHTSPPSLLTNSSARMTQHAKASISDPCGNLLFYTYGDSVWNRNHQAMPNGVGLHYVNSIHTIIAPHPGNTDQYYIFHPGVNYSNPLITKYELYYSIVDLTLDGGMGDLVMKNILLEDSTSFKIAGVQHQNETDIWVVTLDGATSEFHSYLISASGLNTTPIVSYVGLISTGVPFHFLGLGQTKISPDGSKLALCFQASDSTIILDFDPSTGIVSNPLFLPVITSSYNYYGTFGIEFSQDASKFYRVYLNDSVVYQYDLSLGSPTAIKNSVMAIGASSALTGLDVIQLGPDGKLYFNRLGNSSPPWVLPPKNDQYLDIVEKPNLAGAACNFIDKGISLFPGNTARLLPTFLAHYLLPFEIQINQDTVEAFCMADTAFFKISGVRGLDSAIWDFGDPASGALNTANDPAPSHIYNSFGTYFIEAIVYRGCTNPDTLRDTLEVLDQPLVDLGPDTALCLGTILPLSAGNQPMSYLWQDSSILSSFSVDTTGLYWAEASNACGVYRDSVFVGFDTIPALDLGPDTFTCPGVLIPLDVTTLGATYLWQDSSTSPTFSAGGYGGLYWAEVSNVCGTERDSIFVGWDTLPPLDLGADTMICAGQAVPLDASLSSYSPLSFLWENNTSTPTRNITTSGLYWAEVTNNCDSDRDSIQVDVEPIPQVNLGSDQTLCEGEMLLLSAVFPSAQYQWQDGSTDSTFLVTTAGSYRVEIFAFCGTAEDSVVVSYDPIPAIDLGRDTTLCEGETLTLDATFPGASYQWQNGSNQSTFSVSSPGLYRVRLTNTACEFTDSIAVDYEPLPKLDIGRDTLLCDGATLSLDISFPGAQYIWQDGSTSPNFLIAAPGTYWASLTAFCGRLRDTIIVSYGESPEVNLGRDTTLCEGESMLLSAAFPNATYLWQDGSTGSAFQVTGPGEYAVSVQTFCGEVQDEIVVSYTAPPVITPPLQDTTICADASLVLDVSGSGAAYLWQDGSDLPTYEARAEGVYSVIVSNLCGESRDSMLLGMVDCNCYLFVPTGFTPNQDGVNDVFEWGYQCGFLSFDLQIFNRWGKLVYQTANPADGWDGRSGGVAVPEGVYAWRVVYSYEGRAQVVEDLKTGTVTVMR